MEIITGTKEFIIEHDTAVSIGKFDGVHIGHRRLLDEIIEKKKDGLKALVFTFDPYPEVLFGRSDGRLTTSEEKRLLLERMGIDILVEYPMDKETADTDPGIFLRDIVAGRLGASFVAAGPDLSFGAGGRGNIELLNEMSGGLGITVSEVEKVKCDVDGEEKTVSSTLIRSLIEKSDMGNAEKLLGMPYLICGKVVHGNSLGRTLGFPTANIPISDDKIIPGYGVYAADVRIAEIGYKALVNIGVKPTIEGSDPETPSAECFIYDFDGDIYGEDIEVCLGNFIRPEMKFDSVDELKAQVIHDIQKAREN